MPTDYKAIATENLVRYGTEIERIGELLLAHRYSDMTHFVFELLQNAEDALNRRPPSVTLPKSVVFDLQRNYLEFSHYGVPFEEKYVRAICGIGESTKAEELTAIGRFGIGFKSVYTLTKRPEIHSGDEHFAIEAFVRPLAIPSRSTQKGQTLFHIPFSDEQAFAGILQRLRILGHRTLLFLRQIDAIEWKAAGQKGGTYLRDSKVLDSNTRKVTLIGQRASSVDVQMERWLVFDRDVFTPEGKKAGQVEVAYSLEEDAKSKKELIKPISDSCLVVFFPTEKETHLGFLVQGPYQTTPSRDNVPRDAAWNQHLVKETALLVQDSLRQLREMGHLNVGVLNSMPLDASKFCLPPYMAVTEHMFKPVFEAVKECLANEELLPKQLGGFVAGKHAKIARTEALRTLFSPQQLAELYGVNDELHWLTDQITRDKTPELRDYLINQLNLNEVEPETLLTRFSEKFIQKQPDEWVARFYAFLLDQPSLWRYGDFRQKPFIRLESDKHIAPFDDKGRPRAFLPATTKSGFPTVKASVCKNPLPLKFLQQLGLTEPDLVDDVIINVLPPFAKPVGNELKENEYIHAFSRILVASQTDSSSRREKLINKLSETYFVRCRNSKTGLIRYRLPTTAYFPTEKLTSVFRDNPEIWFVDDGCSALKGELPRKFLEACGVRDYLRRISVETRLDWEQERKLRHSKGAVNCTWDKTEDYDVVGLEFSINRIRSLPSRDAELAASTLWQALLDTLREARETYFRGSYTWGYYREQWSAPFPAKFLRNLLDIAWLPAADKTFKRPAEICFSELPKTFSDSPSLALQSLLDFKPEIIQQLAEEAGVDPSVLDLVKKHGLTEEKLRQLLEQAGLEKAPDTQQRPTTVGEAVGAILGQDAPQPGRIPEGLQKEEIISPGRGGGQGGGQPRPSSDHRDGGASSQDGKFFSYVYVASAPTGDAHATSGQTQTSDEHRREKLGREGVDIVLTFEKKAGRKPKEMDQYHEGYDIESYNTFDEVERYIEVKTIRAAWGERGVTLSYPQFKAAQQLGEKFWLYVVECPENPVPVIHRIQNPANMVNSFAYDNGWHELAEPDKPAT